MNVIFASRPSSQANEHSHQGQRRSLMNDTHSVSPFYFFGATQVTNIDPGPSCAMMT
jgi:hypothetical protein